MKRPMKNIASPACSFASRLTIGLIASACLLATVATAQEIFRWVDKAGKVHYGDLPPPPAEVKSLEAKKLTDSVIEQADVSFAVSAAMKNNPVTLYANSCGEQCANAKALLAKRGIPFAEKNPETDPAAALALKEKVGALSVPTIVIGTSNISGFDEASWNAALTGAGYSNSGPSQRQNATKAGPKAVAKPVPATETPAK